MKTSCLYSIVGLFALLTSCQSDHETALEAGKDWPVYLGGHSGAQYSPLDQINTKNVRQLKVAWTLSTGDAESDENTQIQCNPIVVDGTLYGSSPKLKILAVDAATGQEKWRYDPNADINYGMNVNRGVTYHKGEEGQYIYSSPRARSYSAWMRKPDCPSIASVRGDGFRSKQDWAKTRRIATWYPPRRA